MCVCVCVCIYLDTHIIYMYICTHTHTHTIHPTSLSPPLPLPYTQTPSLTPADPPPHTQTPARSHTAGRFLWQDKKSALHMAAHNGHASLVGPLVQAKADVNAVDKVRAGMTFVFCGQGLIALFLMGIYFFGICI